MATEVSGKISEELRMKVRPNLQKIINEGFEKIKLEVGNYLEYYVKSREYIVYNRALDKARREEIPKILDTISSSFLLFF